MLYYPEDLRICVLGHTLWKFRRGWIMRISVNASIAIRCAVAPGAHSLISIYTGLQIVFVERDWILFCRRMANDRSMKNRRHNPTFKTGMVSISAHRHQA